MSELVATTVFGHSPSDSMQVLGRGELPIPGACVVCGSGVYEQGYLFLGVHVDFHGALLLCGLCLLQGGEKFGLMSPDVAKEIHRQSVELAEEVVVLRRENEVQRVRLEVYDGALRSINSDPIGDSSSSSVDVDSIKSPEQLSAEAAQQNDAGSGTEPTESVEDDGLSESSATTGIDLTAKTRKRTIKNVRSARASS